MSYLGKDQTNRSSSQPPLTPLQIYLVDLNINCQLTQIQLCSAAQSVFSQPWWALDAHFSEELDVLQFFINYNYVKVLFECHDPEFTTL